MSRTQMASLARARKNPPRIPQTDCPACHAKPGQRCIGRNGRRSNYAHSVRGRQSLAESGLADLSAWYREMRPYEGQHAKPRPDWLTV